MQSRMSLKNSLCDRVKNEPDLTCWKAADWKKLDAAEIDFPKLDLEYLETITRGSYQIKLAPGYIVDHLSEDGEYEISVNNHSEDLGSYSPTILKNVLGLVLPVFLHLAAFECNTTSNWLNHTV